ncbi:MAG TPA: hypothetical protein VGL00_10165 [Terracidiphilus sp.]
MIQRIRTRRFAAVALLLGVCVIACKKEEQAVVGVAHSAQQAEQKAQAAATERDRERAELAKIPLPTKSLYINVHEAAQWANPFISADADYLTLRVTMADPNPGAGDSGTLLRPDAARRQELQIHPADLAEALIALPPAAWRYGRVVAMAESPLADRKKRPIVRRNVEAAIQKLNDLGVVVDEWPVR